jgi:hypothetical protein
MPINSVGRASRPEIKTEFLVTIARGRRLDAHAPRRRAGDRCAATLETDDKQQICMTWKGCRTARRRVDPETYCFRAARHTSRRALGKYGWMNRICSIATGLRTAGRRTFQVFQVL